MTKTRVSALERRLATTPEAFSSREVAFLAEVSQKAVDQAVDRREVKVLRSRRRHDPSRALGVNVAVYLIVRKEAGEFLTAKAKQRLYQRLSVAKHVPATIDLGPVIVRTSPAVEQIRQRRALLDNIHRFVLSDQAVRGGEPVFQGTRIPIYMIADMLQDGTEEEEILAAYPALSGDALRAAQLYLQLYPRRGRPKQAPWRKTPPLKVIKAGATKETRKQGSLVSKGRRNARVPRRRMPHT
jgi:uncharacterized protein (DUF433 family)